MTQALTPVEEAQQRRLGEPGAITAKLVGEVISGLSRKAREEALASFTLTEVKFFSTSEAAGLGLTIEEGWQLKLAPSEDGFTQTLISPLGEEVSFEDVFITAEGVWITQSQIDAQEAAVPVELGEITPPSLVSPTGRTIEQLLEQLAGPMPTPERIIAEQELATLQAQAALTTLFPEEEIAGVIESIIENPEEFLTQVRELGRSDETVALLSQLGLSADEISTIFWGQAAPEFYLDALPIVVTPNTQERMIEFFNDNPEHLRSALITVGQNTDTVALVEAMFPGIEQGQINDYFSLEARVVENRAEERLGVTKGFWGDLGDMFVAGTGDLVAGIGSALKWLGVDGIGETVFRSGQFMQVYIAPDEFGEFRWEQLLNPKWVATRLTRLAPMLMAFAIPAIGAYGFAGSIVARLGLGTFSRAVLTGIGGAALSRPVESAIEAGSAYDAAINKGLSEVEARQAADKVFWNNMKLVGADVLQITAAFLPTPGRVFSNLVARGLVTTATVGGKLVFTGLTEGGEEVYQDILLRQALGEEIVWDAEMQEVFALGSMAGLGMGAGGHIVTLVSNKVVLQLTPEQKIEFDKLRTDFLAQGLPEDVATTKALDGLEATPELTKIIEKATEDVNTELTVSQLKPKTEADKIAIDQLKEKLRVEPVVPKPLAVEILPAEAGIFKPRDKFTTPQGEVELDIWDSSQRKWVVKLPDGTETRMTVAELDTLTDPKTGTWKKIPAIPTEVVPTEPLVTPLAPIPDNPDVVGAEIVQETGLRYDGLQEGIGLQFTDVEQTGTTFYANSLEEARTRLAEKRALFAKAVPPAEVKVVPPTPAEVVVAEELKAFPTERQVVDEGGELIPPDQKIAKGVADNTFIARDIGILERVRPTRQVFRRMGLYQLHKGIQRAEVELGEARAAFQKKLNEVSKWVKKDRRALVFRELENPGTVKGLTFNERRAVNWFKENFDKWADTLALPVDKRVKNYVTHIFEGDITQQLKEGTPLDPAIARAMEYFTPKTVFNPFLQERLGKKVGLIEDPFVAISAYEARQLKVLYYEPMLQRVAAIANDPKTPDSVRDYLQDYSRRMTSEPSKIDKAINTTIRQFADKLRGLPGGDTLANFLSRGNPAGMASYNFTSALYTLWLGFKPTSAIRNLSQHTLIIGEVGPAKFAEAVSKTLTTESKNAVAESLMMRSRKAAFLPGIDDSFASKWTDKFRETALFMFRKADQVNVRHAFLAGYYEAKALLPEADRQVWIERGDEVAADTQYLYTKMNSFALSQNALGRVFSVLTTWTVNWMELMTKWVSKRPSQVYTEYERATGKKVSTANWSTSYKAIIMYMIIVGLGYAIKEKTPLKAWEYTGITSIRYLADIVGGDFPGLEAPGAVAATIVGFLTGDDRMMATGWNQLRRTLTPGILRQIDQVASGDRDWLTLFLYLEGQDWKLTQLKNKWKPGWDGYPLFTTPEDRAEYDKSHPETDTWSDTKIQNKWRENNPLLEAQMFISNRFSVLSTDEARAEVLRLIEEHGINTDFISGYEKVFGTDSSIALAEFQAKIGTVKPHEEGEEIEYFTATSFAAEVNEAVRIQGRDKVIRDGNKLAIEYLEAKDSFVQYDAIETSDGRKLYRQQFPDIEAQLYLWGQITAFENPKSAELLLQLMDEHNIPPEGVRAFLSDPEKYDELFTQKFKIIQKWFDETSTYDNFGNKESDLYIEDNDERAEARKQFKTDHPEWVDDMRRIEAIDHDAPTLIIEEWVERGRIVDEFSGSSSEVKVWLVDHPETWEWALDQELLTDNGSDWNVPVLRINAEWREKDDAYDAIQFDDDAEQRDARERYLKANPEYAKARRRRDAWNAGFPFFLIEDYVEYYEITDNEGQKKFLREHPVFYNLALELLGWKRRDLRSKEERQPIKPISRPLAEKFK